MAANATGLGPQHQRDRKYALELFQPGDPCAICGRPMLHARSLDLHHLIDRVYGGIGSQTALAHSVCNRRGGAIISARRARVRGRRRAQMAAIRMTQAERAAQAAGTAGRVRNRRRW